MYHWLSITISRTPPHAVPPQTPRLGNPVLEVSFVLHYIVSHWNSSKAYCNYWMPPKILMLHDLQSKLWTLYFTTHDWYQTLVIQRCLCRSTRSFCLIHVVLNQCSHIINIDLIQKVQSLSFIPAWHEFPFHVYLSMEHKQALSLKFWNTQCADLTGNQFLILLPCVSVSGLWTGYWFAMTHGDGGFGF